MNFTDQNFKEEVIDYKGVVLVMFGTEYCFGCRSMSPIINELIIEYKDKVKIGKFDIDFKCQIPKNYNIMSMPTLIIFKNGKVIDNSFGVVSKIKIIEKLNKL